MFLNHYDYSDLTPTQYETAYAWVRDIGLLDDLQSHVPAARRVFRAAVTAGGATWLRDADALIRTPDELPIDAAVAAEALGVGESEAFAEIHSIWGKVDTAERARIGAAGEEVVVDLLRGLVGVAVDHVSTWSDAYGYDIAMTAAAGVGHFEVKATVRRGQAVIYLSRNEFETMQRDPAWSLIMVRLRPDLAPCELSTVPTGWLAAQMPIDRTMLGRWESCRVSVPSEVLVKGVAAVVPLVQEATSPLLTGVFAEVNASSLAIQGS